MPHLHLEHTDDIADSALSRQLLLELHDIVHRRLGVPLANCKSRVRRLDRYLVGDGRPGQSFVHLRIAFLEGRSVDRRQALGRELLERLQRALERTDAEPQITVSVAELERAFYFKHPAGTLSSPYERDA